MLYDPRDWYWTADDDRIFASARVAIINSADPDFIAWLGVGKQATPWPRNVEGEQTTAALQEVLTPHGLFADLTAYAAMSRWEAEISGVVVAGILIATDDRSKQMIMGARIAAEANPSFSTPWVSADGTVSTLAAAEVVGISNAVLAHVQNCFETFALVVAEISSGNITTTTQIDAAFA